MLNRSASFAVSTSVLKGLPRKLDIKRHSSSIIYVSASLAMSSSALEALPGKLDIKRHSPSFIYVSTSLAMSTSVLQALPGYLISKDTHQVLSISRQSSRYQISDIKRHSPSIIYVSTSLAMSTSVLQALPGYLISKDTHLVLSISRQSSRYQISDIKRHSPSII